MNAKPAASPAAVDVFDAIYHRHAVRQYSERGIDRATVERLLDAAIQAPSAMNQQPWAFAIAQGKERLAGFSDLVRANLLAQFTSDSPLARYRAMLENPGFNVFYGASTLIVVLARPPGLNCNEDCCLAAQNLMLAAYALGLGTCPIGFARPWLNTTAGKQALAIPAAYEAIMPIAIGYPQGEIEIHPRKPAEVVSWC
jgi:nitroreductase